MSSIALAALHSLFSFYWHTINANVLAGAWASCIWRSGKYRKVCRIAEDWVKSVFHLRPCRWKCMCCSRTWRRAGVLVQDWKPALFVDKQSLLPTSPHSAIHCRCKQFEIVFANQIFLDFEQLDWLPACELPRLGRIVLCQIILSSSDILAYSHLAGIIAMKYTRFPIVIIILFFLFLWYEIVHSFFM